MDTKKPSLARYEYATEFIYDSFSVYANSTRIDQVLSSYAEQGWRLHSALANDLSNTDSINSNPSTAKDEVETPKQIGVTILIFERPL